MIFLVHDSGKNFLLTSEIVLLLHFTIDSLNLILVGLVSLSCETRSFTIFLADNCLIFSL